MGGARVWDRPGVVVVAGRDREDAEARRTRTAGDAGWAARRSFEGAGFEGGGVG